MKKTFIGLVLLPLSAPVWGQYAAPDPAGSGAIGDAVEWLQGTMLGNVATAIAIMAVAAVGFLMLTGRINWRYGATVVVGLFIVFGAASIVTGIKSVAGG